MDAVGYVQHLDRIAQESLMAMSPAFDEIQFLYTRDDAVSLVPVILQHSQTPSVQMAAGRVLTHFATEKFKDMDPPNRLEFRNFVCQILTGLPPEHLVFASVQKAIVSIAIQEFPETWPEFLPMLFSSTPPNLFLFADFLAAMKNEKNVTPEHRAALRAAIRSILPSCLGGIVGMFPNGGSAECLTELIPYMPASDIATLAAATVYGPNAMSVRCLCEIALYPELPPEIVRHVVGVIAQLVVAIDADEEEDEVECQTIIPVLMQHLRILETAEFAPVLNMFHQKLLDESLPMTAEYWEFFLLSLYGSTKQGEGGRVEAHQGLMAAILMKLLTSFTNPPDYRVKRRKTVAEEPMNAFLYQQECTMLTCLLHINPAFVMQGMVSAFTEVSSNFDADRFMVLVWSAASIASALDIEGSIALTSMDFVYTVYQSFSTDADVTACLIYLATNYIKVGKVTPEMIVFIAGLAYTHRANECIYQVCLEYLLTVSRIVPASLVEIVRPEEVTETVEILGRLSDRKRTYWFTTMGEIRARVCMVTGTIGNYMGLLGQMWGQLMSGELSHVWLRMMMNFLNELIGVARAEPACSAEMITQIVPQLQTLSQQLVQNVCQMGETLGLRVKQRDDAKLMLSCLTTQMQLFRESMFLDCGWIISIYGALPVPLRSREILHLCEFLISSEIPPPMMEVILAAVVRPTEAVLHEEEFARDFQFTDMKTGIVRVICALVEFHLECVIPEDIITLIDYLPIGGHSIRGLGMLCEHIGDMSEQLREAFILHILPRLISSVICISCEHSHLFYFQELCGVAFLAVQLLLAPALASVRLFPDAENIPGICTLLVNEILQNEPLIEVDEIRTIIAAIFATPTQEVFESSLIQLISKAKMTTVAETVQKLTNLKIKDALEHENMAVKSGQ